jgi:anti-sigma-K factor RskA
MNHEEAQELLGVYALNAVDGEERRELDAHIEECLRCSSELDALREAASAMGDVGEPASPEIWQRISEHLYDDVSGSQVPPIRALELPTAVVTPLRSVHGRRPRRLAYSVGAFAVAAAALVGVLSLNLASADNRVNQLQNAIALQGHNAALAAEESPGHVDVTLNAAHDPGIAQFVLLKGHGYLLSSAMAPLSTTKTYQLWVIIGGKSISIGLMGHAPTTVMFTIAGALRPSELAVTVEPAGGSAVPTTPIIASGTITA